MVGRIYVSTHVPFTLGIKRNSISMVKQFLVEHKYQKTLNTLRKTLVGVWMDRAGNCMSHFLHDSRSFSLHCLLCIEGIQFYMISEKYFHINFVYPLSTVQTRQKIYICCQKNIFILTFLMCTLYTRHSIQNDVRKIYSYQLFYPLSTLQTRQTIG